MLALVILGLVFTACGGGGVAPTPLLPVVKGAQGPALELSSSAFGSGQAIPKKYTCQDADVSPPLAWSNAPQGTRSFALIMDDPDAPLVTWVHWVVWNIPATARSLKEAVPQGSDLPDGTKQGRNSGRRAGYSGPCPPTGSHRYFFKLYALDTTLSLAADSGKDQLLEAMKGHILAQAELMGTYKKQ